MKKTLFTSNLGLYGWENIEVVILAALASELPMLLIGKHGCAKSFILERLSQTLKLNYRFYNASLINYDDLVGIPIPVDNNTKLSYISNDNSIWDAEVVFIDEINRTKLELQNKLFPIIYDKRIQGINLNKLKYRWSAMNPPYLVNEDDDQVYQGTTYLDEALADRFPFIINVPEWNELSLEDKDNILKDQFSGRHEIDINLNKLILETKECLESLKKEKNEKLRKYIITLVKLLSNTFSYISTRRATMLYETFLSIYASQIVINKYLKLEKPNYHDVALIHIINTLPFNASMKIDSSVLINISNEALKLSELSNTIEKDFILMKEPVSKVKYMFSNINEININTINDSIPLILNDLDMYKRKVIALSMYLKLRNIKDISAAIMETIITIIKDIFETKEVNELVYLNKKKISDRIDVLVENNKEDKNNVYIENILRSFLPDNYRNEEDVVELFNFSKDYLNEVL